MSHFDEQPDAPLHGECAAEIHRLQARIKELEAPAVVEPVAAWGSQRTAIALIGGNLQVSGQRGLRHLETAHDHPLGAGIHIASGKNEAFLEAICEVCNAAAAPQPTAPVAPTLAALVELAKVYASSYASPHHITFTVEGLRKLFAAAKGATE